MRLIGLIANPASGKDIRRLVAHASVFDNGEKQNILRRVITGAAAAGATGFLFMREPNRMVEGALDSLDSAISCTPVASPGTASALDTVAAAEAMRGAGCAVVVTLGGDGTNRAVAKGWPEAPLIPISTGTNNVFPSMMEGTVAGMAAGLLASSALSLDQVATRAKRVEVQIEGEADDVALIDAALLSASFTGARAIWDPSSLRTIVLTRAEPAAVGLSSIGGLIRPIAAGADGGLLLRIGEDNGAKVRAPIAPGIFADVPIAEARVLAFDEAVEAEGPGMLALDGERERPLRPGQRATLTVRRDGPRVIDVNRTLQLAACAGLFHNEVNDGD